MTIQIDVRGGDTRAQQRFLTKLNDNLRNRSGAMVKMANRMARVWDYSFSREGSEVGGWQALADETISRRDYYGYPAGPILIRYGALRAVVTKQFVTAHSSSSWSVGDDYSGHVTSGALTLSKGKARLEAHGWKIANQWGHPNWRGGDIPARPFWFVNRMVEKEARQGAIEWIVSEAIP